MAYLSPPVSLGLQVPMVHPSQLIGSPGAHGLVGLQVPMAQYTPQLIGSLGTHGPCQHPVAHWRVL